MTRLHRMVRRKRMLPVRQPRLHHLQTSKLLRKVKLVAGCLICSCSQVEIPPSCVVKVPEVAALAFELVMINKVLFEFSTASTRNSLTSLSAPKLLCSLSVPCSWEMQVINSLFSYEMVFFVSHSSPSSACSRFRACLGISDPD